MHYLSGRKIASVTRNVVVRCLLLLQLPLYVVAKLSDDFFQILDKNHDGSLDKTEYDEGMSKLQNFLRQPLVKADGDSFLSRWWPGSSQAGGGAAAAAAATATGAGAASASASALGLVGFWKAFTSAVCMILATEIGDKTFFIAAILSMKHSRCAVFAGAILALILMTILSTAMGLVLPSFLPREYTHFLSGILFLYFGVKLIMEARAMESGKASDELEEVEEELMLENSKKDEDEEEGGGRSASSERLQKKNQKQWYQVTMQAFMLTFVAEWGDRSQIATIALAAAKNPIGVTVGGCLGHSVCTGIAVIGGRMLAARIEEKTVHLYGGMIFLLFGLHSIFLEE